MKKLLITILLLGLTGCGLPEPPFGGDEPIVIYQDSNELTKEEKVRKYIAPVRNFDGIQHEELRKEIDWKYNQAHDALSQAYYEGLEFIWKGENYGILDEETFNKLQGMLWTRYEIMFHEENKKKPKKDQIPEEEYNEFCTEYEGTDENSNCKTIEKKSDKALNKINQYQNENINIDL